MQLLIVLDKATGELLTASAVNDDVMTTTVRTEARLLATEIGAVAWIVSSTDLESALAYLHEEAAAQAATG
jgi:hypothetical protein